MSWIEEIEDKMIIKTGDGKEYFPLWLNASKAKEFNISEFDFPGVEGTLVDRRQSRGTKYNLEIYFQGEDYLDQLLAFELSANDTRAWIISHPFYGQITVQPLSLSIDMSKYNTTQITGTVMETITSNNPKTTVFPKDKIIEDKENNDLTFRSSFESEFVPGPPDILAMIANTDQQYERALTIAPPGEEAEEYFNLYNEANAAIVDVTAEPLAAMRAVQAFINYPALFTATVKARIDMLALQMVDLNNTVENITTKPEKVLYEATGGAIISSMALAAANPLPGNFGNRVQVVYVIDIIYYYYNLYLAYLDSLQSTNGGSTSSFIPDHNSISGLDALIDFTIANLVTMSLGAKIERVLYLEDDSNVILLAHRFYGLKTDDSSIDEFIENNSIGLNEILGVRKGRKILYYT